MDAAQADPGSGGNILFQFFLLVILILVNAFYSASEMALISVDKNIIREKAEEGQVKAKRILKLLDDPSKFLSTIQVCITLAGFFNAAFAATGISQGLGDGLFRIGVPRAYQLATILFTILLSFVTIIFGELIPKRLALKAPEQFAFSASGVLWWSYRLLKPCVHLLSSITNALLRAMGVEINAVEEKVTMSDIKSIVQVGQSQGLINVTEEEMINSIISFDNKTAEEIMTPRTSVFAIDITDPPSEYMDELLSVHFSRIPVYDDDIDNIIGVLYIKDYMQEAYEVGFDQVDIQNIVRPAYFVPERKNVNELFNELRENNSHIAVLIDEYGGFSGIVTMEDLIEEIVGDIDDEYDSDEPEINKIGQNTYMAKGTLSIKELNSNIGSEFDEENEDYDSLGGLLFYLMGRIPEDTEQPFVEYDQCQFFIRKMSNKKIEQVRIEYDREKVKKEKALRFQRQEE